MATPNLTPLVFPFRPRYTGVAWSAIGLGVGLFAIGIIAPAYILNVIGAVGVVLGFTYLRSSTWRLQVELDDEHITVPGRFELAWTDVVRVLASPTTQTCFVDGGSPARSLLVPGDGAPAPYKIKNSEKLYAAIRAHVAKEKIRDLENLSDVGNTPD